MQHLWGEDGSGGMCVGMHDFLIFHRSKRGFRGVHSFEEGFPRSCPPPVTHPAMQEWTQEALLRRFGMPADWVPATPADLEAFEARCVDLLRDPSNTFSGSSACRRCRHPRPSTAGHWTPSPIAAGVVSTITTGALAATFNAAITAVRPPAAS